MTDQSQPVTYALADGIEVLTAHAAKEVLIEGADKVVVVEHAGAVDRRVGAPVDDRRLARRDLDPVPVPPDAGEVLEVGGPVAGAVFVVPEADGHRRHRRRDGGGPVTHLTDHDLDTPATVWLDEPFEGVDDQTLFNYQNGAWTRLEQEMVGTSPRSWSDAARQAVATASKTVRNIHMVLGKALNDAVRWGIVKRNVAPMADPPPARAAATAQPGRDEGDRAAT